MKKVVLLSASICLHLVLFSQDKQSAKTDLEKEQWIKEHSNEYLKAQKELREKSSKPHGVIVENNNSSVSSKRKEQEWKIPTFSSDAEKQKWIEKNPEKYEKMKNTKP